MLNNIPKLIFYLVIRFFSTVNAKIAHSCLGVHPRMNSPAADEFICVYLRIDTAVGIV
jgi:hypothetical protein